MKFQLILAALIICFSTNLIGQTLDRNEFLDQNFESFSEKIQEVELENNIYLNKKYHIEISENDLQSFYAYAYNYSKPKSLNDKDYNFNKFVVKDSLDNYTRIQIVNSKITYSRKEGVATLSSFLRKGVCDVCKYAIVIEKDIQGNILSSWKYGQVENRNQFWTEVDNIEQRLETISEK